MAFWNRKKQEPAFPIQSLFDSGAIKDLERAIRQSTVATEESMKRFQDLTKALDNASRSFKKISSK